MSSITGTNVNSQDENNIHLNSLTSDNLYPTPIPTIPLPSTNVDPTPPVKSVLIPTNLYPEPVAPTPLPVINVDPNVPPKPSITTLGNVN